jgi:hypothetical protein
MIARPDPQWLIFRNTRNNLLGSRIGHIQACRSCHRIGDISYTGGARYRSRRHAARYANGLIFTLIKSNGNSYSKTGS